MRRTPYRLAAMIAAASLCIAALALGQTSPAEPTALPAPTTAPSTGSGPATAPSEPELAPGPLARQYLLLCQQDPNRKGAFLGALRATDDVELVPMFIAYSQSGDKQIRIFATAALAEIKGDAAVAAMFDRVMKDPMMAIRSQALAHLLEMKALSVEQLQQCLKIDDENVRCLAARGLVLAGHGDLAAETLTALTGSKDVTTSCLARMCLLGLGKKEQYEPLAKIFSDGGTSIDVVQILLEQIYEEKIAVAVPLAEGAATTHSSQNVRLLALRSMAEVSPTGAQKLLDAIRKSDSLVSRVVLFRALAAIKENRPYLAALIEETDAIGPLAKFELARAAGGQGAAKAAADVAALRHPIVVAHMLDRIQQDIASGGSGAADVYTPVLAQIVRNVPEATGRVGQEQEAAAFAATLLADLGTENSLAELKELLAANQTDVKRAASGGLLKSKNAVAAPLAIPMLESPYDELAVTATLTLGRHANPAAANALAGLIRNHARFRPSIPVMASWFLLKIEKQSAAVAAELTAAAK